MTPPTNVTKTEDASSVTYEVTEATHNQIIRIQKKPDVVEYVVEVILHTFHEGSPKTWEELAESIEADIGVTIT